MTNRAEGFSQLHGMMVTYRDDFGNYIKVSKPTKRDFMLSINEHAICISEENLMQMIDGAKINPKDKSNGN